MATSRYLSGFQNLDGSLLFTLPQYSYIFAPSQELRSSDLWIAGRDFPLDLYATKPLPLGDAEETANFVTMPSDDSLVTLDANIDAMKQALYYGVQGYVLSTGADGTVRRARARIKS
jgi:hypothetical protein